MISRELILTGAARRDYPDERDCWNRPMTFGRVSDLGRGFFRIQLMMRCSDGEVAAGQINLRMIGDDIATSLSVYV